MAEHGITPHIKAFITDKKYKQPCNTTESIAECSVISSIHSLLEDEEQADRSIVGNRSTTHAAPSTNLPIQQQAAAGAVVVVPTVVGSVDGDETMRLAASYIFNQDPITTAAAATARHTTLHTDHHHHTHIPQTSASSAHQQVMTTELSSPSDPILPVQSLSLTQSTTADLVPLVDLDDLLSQFTSPPPPPTDAAAASAPQQQQHAPPPAAAAESK